MSPITVFGPSIVTNGLVVYYDFANPRCAPSGDIVNNLIPAYSNITASLSGSGANRPTLVSNTYLSFNRLNENFMYYNLPSMGPSFTSILIASSPTSNWVVVGTNQSTLIDGITPSTPLSAYRLFTNPSDSVWGVMRTSIGGYGNTSNNLAPSITSPHYYYCSFDNSTGNTRYGVDSNIVYSETLSTTNRGTGTNASFYFSRFNPYYFVNFGARFLDSNIYYHMYYNRALSATEISQNYNAVKKRFGFIN